MTLCIHFGTCGGCAHQDLSADVYRAMKRDLVVQALAKNGLATAAVDDIVEVPPNSRRRATFKAEKRGGEVQIGFHAARLHDIVDMRECHVLTLRLFALVSGLREMMRAMLRDGEKTDIDVTDSDAGFDVALRGMLANNPDSRAQVARWATSLKLARVSVGGNVLVELGVPAVRLRQGRVVLPPGAFLQPTRKGEAALQARVPSLASRGAKRVADLFRRLRHVLAGAGGTCARACAGA